MPKKLEDNSFNNLLNHKNGIILYGVSEDEIRHMRSMIWDEFEKSYIMKMELKINAVVPIVKTKNGESFALVIETEKGSIIERVVGFVIMKGPLKYGIRSIYFNPQP